MPFLGNVQRIPSLIQTQLSLSRENQFKKVVESEEKTDISFETIKTSVTQRLKNELLFKCTRDSLNSIFTPKMRRLSRNKTSVVFLFWHKCCLFSLLPTFAFFSEKSVTLLDFMVFYCKNIANKCNMFDSQKYNILRHLFIHCEFVRGDIVIKYVGEKKRKPLYFQFVCHYDMFECNI